MSVQQEEHKPFSSDDHCTLGWLFWFAILAYTLALWCLNVATEAVDGRRKFHTIYERTTEELTRTRENDDCMPPLRREREY